MSLTHYVTLGRSGLRVSPLCLGTMTFGEDLGWGASVQESEAILDRYIALGGNFIDTANFYTLGHSEHIIGHHLGRHPAKRDRLVIATKFFGNMFPADPNGGGTGRKALIGACHESLRRLKTDYIDLYWMHLWDQHTPIEETLLALQDLVQAGKVRYVGFSDTPAWKVAQAQTIALLRGWAPLVALQIEYSLIERTVEGELTPMAQEMGLGVTPWSPLKGGLLSGKYTRSNHGSDISARAPMLSPHLNERTYAIVDALADIARATESTPASVALSWVCARPGVASPIIGARTLSQLEQNLSAVTVKLTSEQTKRLDKLSEPELNFPAKFLDMGFAVMHGGLTVNGIEAPTMPFVPKVDSPKY